MAEIRLNQYLASVRVHLPEETLLQHSPSSPMVIGTELAHQVAEYARQHQLGYFPALEFFEANGGLDPDLLDAVESMSWLVSRLVREEIQRKLRQVFSSIKFQAVQSIAYTMPSVRYGSNNAMLRLAEHYTPLDVKLDIVLSLINRKQGEQGFDSFIRGALDRWLKDSFESIEISSVVNLSD